jgi:chemotaxis protein CheZ
LQNIKVDNTHPLPLNQNTKEDEQVVAIAQHMATLLNQIGTMETFIKRRFDEISMEINATSQQIDMSESDMAKRFGEILGVMNSISFSGDGSTAANTGVELEAVIADTSKAANTILDATDRMDLLLNPVDASIWDKPDSREQALNALREDLSNIMVACSFQDIAGQRIRKTLESITDVEDRLSHALESIGIGPESLQAAASSTKESNTKSGNSQDDIDALFS